MVDRKVTKLVDPRELELDYPMAAGAVISIGDMVVLSTAVVATGVAERPTEALGLTGLGMAVEAKDNTGGAAGDERIRVSTAPHALTLEAGSMTLANLGDPIYAVSPAVVDGDSDGATRSLYGRLYWVDSLGQLFVQPSINDSAARVEALETGFQRGTATLASGTITVDTTIVLSATSRIFVSHDGRPTGSTDYAGLAVVSRTTGVQGVAEFDIEAIVAAGTIDADAAGDVDWLIID